MFDRLDSLSDELLAAYLDGNTTPEENLKYGRSCSMTDKRERLSRWLAIVSIFRCFLLHRLVGICV